MVVDVIWLRICVSMILGSVIIFFLSWASVRRGSISSELLMCGKGVCSILLLPLVARDNRCMYMSHVGFYVCCSDCVGVCGNVCCVAAVVENSVFLSLGVLSILWVCVGDVMDVVFSVFIVRRGAVDARVLGSVSVSSCRCCMFVSFSVC